MSNDPRDHNGDRLKSALLTLGRDTALRAELLAWLKSAEKKLAYVGSIRDDVTGPIIDALHSDDDCYSKTLENGTQYEFLYRTKIARDFLLSERDKPTHVWEPQTTRLLQLVAAHSSDDVLIGGAYFGDHAILIAKALAQNGRRVHCFEPNTAQLGMLERNIALNSLGNVLTHKLGLWDEGSKSLKLDGFDSFANVVEADGGEDTFHTVRIDDYCQAKQARLGLIMLDIEGAELRALRGAQHILARDKPTVIFEVHRDYVDWSQGLDNTDICKLLTGLGYKVYGLRDFNTNQEMDDLPIELVPAESVYLEGPPHGFNMVAVPHEASWLNSPEVRIVQNVSPKLLWHRNPALHHPGRK